MRSFLSLRLALIHANTTGPISLKFRTKLTDIPRNNLGFLLIRSFPPFQDGGRLYDVRGFYLVIIKYLLPYNPNQESLGYYNTHIMRQQKILCTLRVSYPPQLGLRSRPPPCCYPINCCYPLLSELTVSLILLTYKENNKADRVDPCGTPTEFNFHADETSSDVLIF